MFAEIALFLSAAPEPRMFALDSQTIIQIVAQIVSVSVLAFFMGKLLYRPVRDFMARRSERIQNQLNDAESEVAKANQLKLEYEQKVEAINRERDEILENARKLAAESSRRMLEEAKAEADAVKERAQANVKLEFERAQDDMKRAIVEVAAVMAAKFMRKAIDSDAHNMLFEEAMQEMEEASWRS